MVSLTMVAYRRLTIVTLMSIGVSSGETLIFFLGFVMEQICGLILFIPLSHDLICLGIVHVAAQLWMPFFRNLCFQNCEISFGCQVNCSPRQSQNSWGEHRINKFLSSNKICNLTSRRVKQNSNKFLPLPRKSFIMHRKFSTVMIITYMRELRKFVRLIAW